MAEHELPPVGSVAEEAARLLDALGGWAGTTAAGYAAGPGQRPGAPSDDEGSRASDEPETPDPTLPGQGSSRCGSCGADRRVGTAATCQLCPLCQGIGILRSVRPETVDRLADLAGVLAAALREVAAHGRAAHGAEPGGTAARGPAAGGRAAHDSPTGPARPRSHVEEIVVEDGNADGEGGAGTHAPSTSGSATP